MRAEVLGVRNLRCVRTIKRPLRCRKFEADTSIPLVSSPKRGAVSIQDVFEPRYEPAKSIYLAFQEEASKRSGRSLDDWISAERDRVFKEATHLAKIHGLRAPTIREVLEAESGARGHIDYGAKWAHYVVASMRR
jgi:hypothetical protein